MSSIHYRLKKRLYRLKAYRRKGFGIHSPFTFHLITNVIESKSQFYAFSELQQHRKFLIGELPALLKSDVLTEYQKMETSRDLKIIKKGEAIDHLIFRLMNSKKAVHPLFIGDGLSLTLAYMARYDSRNQLRHAGISFGNYNKTLLYQPLKITNVFNSNLDEKYQSDFVVISEKLSMDLLNTFTHNFEQYLTANCYVIFINLHKNDKIFECWKLLKKNRFFSLGIDMFHIGILISRPGMQKQNYVRKYRF